MNKDFINYINDVFLENYIIDYDLWIIKIKFEDDSICEFKSYYNHNIHLYNISDSNYIVYAFENKKIPIKEITICYKEINYDFAYECLNIKQYTMEELKERYIEYLKDKIKKNENFSINEKINIIKNLKNELKNILGNENE